MDEQLRKPGTAQHVLIAHAPKTGATRNIAEAIGETLNAPGLRAEVRAADEVVQIQLYDAIILGSGLHNAHWLPEAAEFLESFQEELATKPLWLFSTGRGELGGVRAQAVSRYVPAGLTVLVAATGPEDGVLFADTLDALDSTRPVGLRDQETVNQAVRGWATTIAVRLHARTTTTTARQSGTKETDMSTRHSYFTEADARRIGESLHVTWEAFSAEQFRLGLDVEREHGRVDPATDVTHDNAVLTGKIALAHLNEFPDYYTRLAIMEAEAEAFWQARAHSAPS